MTKRLRFRGYIGTREYGGQRVPHHVQNIVIRDFCQRRDSEYLLSVVEYAMPGSYIMLEEVFRELYQINGIALYSIFMLPEDKNRRRSFYKKIIDAKASLHGALENLTITDKTSMEKVEDIIAVNDVMKKTNPLLLQTIKSKI